MYIFYVFSKDMSHQDTAYRSKKIFVQYYLYLAASCFHQEYNNEVNASIFYIRNSTFFGIFLVKAACC